MRVIPRESSFVSVCHDVFAISLRPYSPLPSFYPSARARSLRLIVDCSAPASSGETLTSPSSLVPVRMRHVAVLCVPEEAERLHFSALQVTDSPAFQCPTQYRPRIAAHLLHLIPQRLRLPISRSASRWKEPCLTSLDRRPR